MSNCNLQFANRLFLTENVRQDDNDRFGEHPTYRMPRH